MVDNFIPEINCKRVKCQLIDELCPGPHWCTTHTKFLQKYIKEELLTHADITNKNFTVVYKSCLHAPQHF